MTRSGKRKLKITLWIYLFFLASPALAENINLTVLDETKKEFYHLSFESTDRVLNLFFYLQARGFIQPQVDSWIMFKQVSDSRSNAFLIPEKTFQEQEITSGTTIKLLYGKEYSHLVQAKTKKAWEELELKWGIRRKKERESKGGNDFPEKETQQIVSSTGEVFHPTVLDYLESSLRMSLRNPTKAKAIAEAFRKNINPYFRKKGMSLSSDFFIAPKNGQDFESSDRPDVLYRRIQTWFIQHIYVLGSTVANPYPQFQEAFKTSHIDSELIFRVRKLLEDIIRITHPDGQKGNQIHPTHLDQGTFPPQRILILTSSSFGGGHKKVGEAIEKTLKDLYEETEIKILDTRIATQHSDPLMILSGGKMHSEQIYDEIYQKQNDPIKADAYWRIMGQISDYIPDRLLESIENEIRAFHPTLLISCLHHFPEFIQLAYSFDLPLAIVSTDFELQTGLSRYVPSLDDRLVKILTTTDQPIFFSKLQRAGHLWQNFLPVSTQRRFDRIIWGGKENEGGKEETDQAQTPLADLHGLNGQGLNILQPMNIFRYLGLPLRPELKYNQDPQFLVSARKRLKIPSNSKVITLAMGAQGGGSLEESLKQVEKAIPSDQQVAILVLCGANQALFEKIKKSSEHENEHAKKIEVYPLGTQDAAQMNEIYNLSDVYISKPGGVSTAEVAHLQVPFMSIEYHPWEKGNSNYLEKIGQGKDISKKISKLSGYLRQYLVAPRRKPPQFTSKSAIQSSTEFATRLDTILKEMLDKRKNLHDFRQDLSPSVADGERLYLDGHDRFKIQKDLLLLADQNDRSHSQWRPHRPDGDTLPDSIFMIFLDTVRRDHLTDARTPHIAQFMREEIDFPNFIAAATATQHALFSLFHAKPALLREMTISSLYESGSQPLKWFKSMGYKLHLLGRPSYYSCQKSDHSLYASGSWSDISQMQLLFSREPGEFLTSCSNPMKEYFDYEKKSLAESDRYIIQQLHKKLDTFSAPTRDGKNFYMIFLDASHDKYSWEDDSALPGLLPGRNNEIDRNPRWYHDGMQEVVKNSYTNSLMNADANFQKILSDLESRPGVYEDSLILFFSDHGERLFEDYPDWYGPLNFSGKQLQTTIGHAGPAFNPVVTVPLTIKLPQSWSKPKERLKELAQLPASHMNIFPTLITLLGQVAHVPTQDFLKWSLQSQLENPKNPPFCPLTASPNGQNFPVLLALSNGQQKAFMRILYNHTILGMPQLEDVSFELDHFTDMTDHVIPSAERQKNSFFNEHFKPCFLEYFDPLPQH